ncbi:MAG: hypothetical protein JNL70_24290 [Saprospiraceae bacterium]|nr:hypothetical protein [Saprospiraceae bacterium]
MDDNLIQWEEPVSNPTEIREVFRTESMGLYEWQALLAAGWRHNGTFFFRVSHEYDEKDRLLNVLPLRYRLELPLQFTKSQLKIWRKNQDLNFRLMPLNITDEIHFLFAQHTQRFKFNVPETVYDFVSPIPNSPFPTYQFEVYKNDKLIACTFVDILPNVLSSTYAMFDLEESKRSLGVFTMILEMAYGASTKKLYHYPGYAHLQPSYMDYKKNFLDVEYYDWQTGNWFKL